MFNDQEPNPYAKIKNLADVKRERALTKLEVKNLLKALSYEELIYQDVMNLLLLIGLRKSCVFSMEWRKVDHEHDVWVIPTNRIKAKRPHAVPLTVEVMDILKCRSTQAVQGEKFAFPAPRSTTGHITERGSLRIEEKEQNVTTHELQRSIVNWSAMLDAIFR